VVGAYAGTYKNGNWSGYISGACPGGNCQNQEKPPYVHDFGSILNFIEYVFGQNGKHLGDPGGIGGSNNNGTSYPYADWFAPDGPNGLAATCSCARSDFPTSLISDRHRGSLAALWARSTTRAVS
jgi:hypothetical protein